MVTRQNGYYFTLYGEIGLTCRRVAHADSRFGRPRAHCVTAGDDGKVEKMISELIKRGSALIHERTSGSFTAAKYRVRRARIRQEASML